MSDRYGGIGWWIGVDGRWYPPEARGAVNAPAPAPVSGASDPGLGVADDHASGTPSGITVRNWKQAIPRPDPTVQSSQWNPPGAVHPHNIPPAPVKGPPPVGFEDNPFRVEYNSKMPPPTRKRGRLALPLKLLIIAVLIAAVATVGFVLTHPSPLRSPDAVSLDFYKQIEHSQFASARKDVLPSQIAAANLMGTLPEVKLFVQHVQSFSSLEVSSPAPPTSGTDLVSMQGCGADFSCAGLESVPTVKVKGSWYVDFEAWDSALPHQ